MAKGIDEIITDVQDYLDDLKIRIEQGTKAIAILRDLKFGTSNRSPRYPEDPGGMISQQIKISAAPPEIVKPENKLKSSRSQKQERRGGARRKDSTSQFKGVRKDKRGYVDGREKWLVNYYDRQNKKLEYLGSFDNEFLAAAAYAERDGNKQEAARLQDLVSENQELNPNKPIDKRKFNCSDRLKKTIWICLRCGTEYKTKKPQADENGLLPCGCHDGLREIPEED